MKCYFLFFPQINRFCFYSRISRKTKELGGGSWHWCRCWCDGSSSSRVWFICSIIDRWWSNKHWNRVSLLLFRKIHFSRANILFILDFLVWRPILCLYLFFIDKIYGYYYYFFVVVCSVSRSWCSSREKIQKNSLILNSNIKKN